jgi:hypothetical protein
MRRIIAAASLLEFMLCPVLWGCRPCEGPISAGAPLLGCSETYCVIQLVPDGASHELTPVPNGLITGSSKH